MASLLTNLNHLKLNKFTLYTVKPAQTTTCYKRLLLFPRRFILYILTGFYDHLHNATNDCQNAFPNDHFNFFQQPLILLHDELTTKMGKLTGNVPQRSHSFSVYTNRVSDWMVWPPDVPDGQNCLGNLFRFGTLSLGYLFRCQAIWADLLLHL